MAASSDPGFWRISNRKLRSEQISELAPTLRKCERELMSQTNPACSKIILADSGISTPPEPNDSV